MKRIIIIISVFFCAHIAQAQLKVHSSGRVGIDRPNEFSYAKLTIGNLDDAAYFKYLFNIFSKSYAESDFFNLGIDSDVYPSQPKNCGRAIGVRGSAGGTTNGYNYGVLGYLEGGKNGAGIYGTTVNMLGLYVPGQYAGYFDGATRVDGTLTATSFVELSDMRLKENVMSLDAYTNGPTLDRVMDMNVIAYHYKAPQYADADTLSESQLKARHEARKLDQVQHFGLSAQELQTIYPELVVEGQDGHLGINYMELVPILIRSIQELKQELDEARTSSDNDLMRSRTATDIPSATTSSSFQLFQNDPNPFTERTTIRFTLPDDAQNVYIYIFDMQGKLQKQMPVDASMRSVTINGYELQPGMYIYSLVVGGKEIDTKRMILSK